MAAGWLAHLAGDAVEVRSAGSIPAEQVNPAAVAAMAEVGIDIADQRPKVLTSDACLLRGRGRCLRRLRRDRRMSCC
jgi:arsenate reductase